MRKSVFLLFFITLFSQQAQSGILVEPYLGMGIGMGAETKLNVSGTTYGFESSGGSGLEYGARLGYQHLGFFIAGDYSLSSFEIEDQVTSADSTTYTGLSNNKTEVDQTSIGVTIGYELPVMFRFWGRYMFNVSWDMEKDSLLGSDDYYKTELSGSGIAFGVGFTGFPLISLFAEYSSVTVDTVDTMSSNGISIKSFITNYERSRQRILVGVSIPFNL